MTVAGEWVEEVTLAGEWVEEVTLAGQWVEGSDSSWRVDRGR